MAGAALSVSPVDERCLPRLDPTLEHPGELDENTRSGALPPQGPSQQVWGEACVSALSQVSGTPRETPPGLEALICGGDGHGFGQKTLGTIRGCTDLVQNSVSCLSCIDVLN